MKSLVAVLLCIVSVSLAFSANQEKFSQVRIFATSPADFRRIEAAGLFIDNAITKTGQYSDSWLSASEIELLKKSGISYRILIDDWDAYYASFPQMSQSQREAATRQSSISHSIYGSMGGFLTYTEVVAKLDSMRLQYPNLISTKFSIGTTIEGRTMWAARVTKNPDAPTGRPEVLYHALIHAREPESMETQMYYFYWLFENYGTDPLATYILENREIYWVPVFNCDGYVYNQTTNPGGGGMWRANRHNTGSNCGYVDLNRNFGTYQYWNSSNGGSGTDPCEGGQGTYRGPIPFSEIETQNIRDFVASRNFNSSFGAHTYGNYLIKPWAWSDPSPTPDDAKFNLYLADMKASNPVYTIGTPSQTVGYFVRGGADDWYYNDSSHAGHHIIAITPETGATGFWPTQPEIIPLAQGMLFNNQYMSLIGGPFVNPLSKTFDQPTYAAGQSGTYKVVFRNKGALAATNVKVTLTSPNPGLTIPTTQFIYPSLASFAADSSVFSFTISPGVADNSAIPVLLTLKLDTTTIYTYNAYVLIGAGAIVLNDSANTFTNWVRSTGGTWAVTTAQFHTAPSSFTDSPGGNYGNNADNSMILASPINATTTPVLSLSFYHRYATEDGYDFCNVEASSDNGTTWQPVANYTGTLSTWTQQTFDLSNYANGSSQFKIRFRLTSDVSVTADGWYVDDIRIRGYGVSLAPDTGVFVRPNSLSYSGITGRVFRDSIKISNLTPGAVQVTVAESTAIVTDHPSFTRAAGRMDMQSIIKRLRPAFQRAHLTAASFRPTAVAQGDNPEAYTTIITDERNENGFGAADVYRVQHQVRSVLGVTFEDFRIVLGILPDTNVVGFISIDTDQDFGTGDFPAPFGIGSTMLDIGSEREILIDASGIIVDSLTGLGRIPAGVVINSATDSLVGTPFLLSIARDSVLTLTTTNFLGLGIRQDWLGDADGNYNVGVEFSRLRQGASPLPDFAPGIGHGTIGTEAGVSWLSENASTMTIASGDSGTLRIAAVAARPPGTYNAALRLLSPGRPTINIPVQLNVTALAQPHIVLNAAGYTDTVRVGDSTMHTLTISNTGNADLVWGIVDTNGTSWMSAAPAFGSTPASQSSPSTITLRTAGLTANTTYTSRFMVLSNDQAAGSLVFPISLRVTPFVSVEDKGTPLPTSYALHQNYPNPFNPETNVSFDLPKSTMVTLKIFNLIGQEVATIVNGQLPAGTHSYKVGGERYGLTSGVYFYRLSAGDFVQTRKMVLLR